MKSRKIYQPSRHLISATILCWASIVVLAGFDLYKSIALPSGFLPWFGLFVFLVALLLLWGLLAHMIACILIKLIDRVKTQQNIHAEYTRNIPVAILLCTRDDWMEGVAKSCLQAMQPIDHLFICDDSASDIYKKKIDDFADSSVGRCTVLRRSNLEGWKAGNLNHCLHDLPKQFQKFMVVDHDNFIDAKMINCGVAEIEQSNDIAFVQFPNEDDDLPSSKFAADLSSSIRGIWWFLSLRVKHGFAFTLGHSVLFRRDYVEKIGGFPENILTEDLAITMKLLNNGYRGVYNLIATSKESIPGSYTRYRSRYIRWCIGTLQSWVDTRVRLSLKKVSVFTIVDALLLAFNLLYAIPILMLVLGIWITPSDVANSITHPKHSFSVVTALSLLSPNFPLLLSVRKTRKIFYILAVNTAVYLSMIVPTLVTIFSSFLLRQFDFLNTGNMSAKEKWNFKHAKERLFIANGLGTLTIEFITVVIFSLNIFHIGPLGVPFLVGIICGPIFIFFDWDSWIADIAKWLPFTSIIVAIVLTSV